MQFDDAVFHRRPDFRSLRNLDHSCFALKLEKCGEYVNHCQHNYRRTGLPEMFVDEMRDEMSDGRNLLYLTAWLDNRSLKSWTARGRGNAGWMGHKLLVGVIASIGPAEGWVEWSSGYDRKEENSSPILEKETLNILLKALGPVVS